MKEWAESLMFSTSSSSSSEHEESKGGKGRDPGGRDPLPQGREGTPGTPGGSGEGEEPVLGWSAQLPGWHEVLPAEGLQPEPGADGERRRRSWSPGPPTVPEAAPPGPGPDPSGRSLTWSPPPPSPAPPAPALPHPADRHEL